MRREADMLIDWVYRDEIWYPRVYFQVFAFLRGLHDLASWIAASRRT